MAKKKRGRIRGRGTGPRGGNGYRWQNRPSRNPPGEGDATLQTNEPQDNGEVGPLEAGGGVLEMHPNGYGFLRDPNEQLHRAS